MFAARIEEGTVTQVAVLGQGQQAPDGWVTSETRVGIGWAYADDEFSPPESEGTPELFPDLDPWKFNAQIEIEGLSAIVDAVIGAIPDPVERAKIRARRLYSPRYHRSDPLFDQLAPFVWTESEDPTAELDAVWSAAAQL